MLERNGFHDRLRTAINRRAIKPLALGMALGVSESAISRWRHGGRISLDHLALLCSFLGVSADWLLLERHPPPPPETGSGKVSVTWGLPE